jgi:hypothetical protein
MFKQLFRGRQLNRTREILELFMAPKYTTAERNTLVNPKKGQIIYNTTSDKLNVYTGSWEEITSI